MLLAVPCLLLRIGLVKLAEVGVGYSTPPSGDDDQQHNFRFAFYLLKDNEM